MTKKTKVTFDDQVSDLRVEYVKAGNLEGADFCEKALLGYAEGILEVKRVLENRELMNDPHAVRTAGPSREVFSGDDSARLAFLLWRRFGRHDADAHWQWQQLLGNSCTTEQFMLLVRRGQHLEA